MSTTIKNTIPMGDVGIVLLQRISKTLDQIIEGVDAEAKDVSF